MGEGIIHFYRTKLRKEHKLAFKLTFVVALLVHMYKFTNTLQNHDAVLNYYTSQNVMNSGRWALSLACSFSSYFDLPWVNGVLSCIMIGLTALVIVALLEINNPVLIILTGSLLAVSPGITETFFFSYTADGYMIAMFLSALAVYYSRLGEKRPSRWIISGICVCVSCGIYQAYLSFSLILAVCYFAIQLLRNRYEKCECIKWIVCQTVMYAVSLAVYYVVWRLCLHLFDFGVSHYQGIDEVGKVSFSLLKNGLIGSIQSVCLYFLGWNVFANGFTIYSIVNIVFILLMLTGVVISVVKSKIWKRKWAFVLLIMCFAAVIPFACVWHFTSDSVQYRPMMLQSITLLFVLTAVLFEDWAHITLKNVAAFVLTSVVFSNAVLANICYFHMNLCYERTQAEALEMIMQIKDYQHQYDVEEIAFIGNRTADLSWPMFDERTGAVTFSGKYYILTCFLETSLLSEHNHIIPFLHYNYGVELNGVSHERLSELSALPEVDEMACWPSDNSIAILDDVLVIKLSDAMP